MTSRCIPPLIQSGFLAALALSLLTCPEAASAGLNYDLRVSADGSKAAIVTAVGQVITLDLYAQVTGAMNNPAPEGFQDGYGSVLSSNGGNILGNLSSTLAAPFNANGSQAGTSQTLDADTDRDVGSNGTVASDSNFFDARSALPTTTGGTSIANGDGTEFKIASFSFTVQSVANFFNTTPISVNFRVPVFPSGLDIEAVWSQDGKAMNSKGLNGGAFPTVGASVQLSTIPEPSATCLLGLALAGFAARRRRRA